ncbi:MAG: DUF86 domain-containing protein [Synergistaceae bacterium]|jgi:uncharacterized protein with HEPN domain/predicted nucleotidyltransferase|nr:DUF86 domain-containing protein [Synergistaceae bacterium]
MSEGVIYSVDRISEMLRPVLAGHGVKRAVLFGSYAKGEASPKSDVDLVVDSGLEGLAFVGLIQEIHATLDKDVDLLDVTHIDEGSAIYSEIARHGVTVYEEFRSILDAMIDHIDRIETYAQGYSSCDEFADNVMAVEACVFNLLQIGEKVNRLDAEFIAAHPAVPWNSIYGLRNRIVHDYEGVNFLLIWQIIRDDLPRLKEDVSKIIAGA